MTAAEMLTDVRKIIEDENTERFSDTDIYLSLLANELKVANLVHKNYLSELRVIDASETFASGALTISSLSNSLLGGADGVITVKTSDSYYANKVEPNKLTDLNSLYRTGNAKSPVIFVFDAKIHIIPTTITTGDVYSLKQPTGIALGVDSDLNEVLHPIIVNFTCAELLAIDGKLDKSNLFENRGITSVKTLNDKYREDKEDIK